jgi:hypothetical protein
MFQILVKKILGGMIKSRSLSICSSKSRNVTRRLEIHVFVLKFMSSLYAILFYNLFVTI